MKLRRRNKNIKTEVEESSFEIDLAPMLALMVTLIPIMLLSTVFVKVMVIDTTLPQVVQKAMDRDRQNKKRVTEIKLKMSLKGYQIVLVESGAIKKRLIISKDGNRWNNQELYQEALKIKKAYPNIFRIDLSPEQSVSYADIVKAIDTLRNIKSEDGKIQIIDPDTKETADTDILFPDVIFDNVMEG